MRIRIDLDEETVRRLATIAVRERRPIPMQAEVLLLAAIAAAERAASEEKDTPAGASGGQGLGKE